jgi:glycosyltransferase involved in cell wall biosynthesis
MRIIQICFKEYKSHLKQVAVEGLKMPPMEAIACKCAVVATNVGAISDYTITGETALVVPLRKPELLAKNIILLIENEEKMKNLSEVGHKYIKKFTWEKATSKFENIIES